MATPTKRRSARKRANTAVSSRARTRLLIAAVLMPPLISLIVLFAQLHSFPYQDDFHAILAFAVRFNQLHGLGAKCLYIAAAQHNEYKLIFEHTIMAAELILTHRINFTFLAAIGNLFVLPIGYLLWKDYPIAGGDLRAKLCEFIPVSLIFFAIGYWKTLDWAMAGLQNLPVVCFGLLAISLLTGAEKGTSNWRIALAGIAALIATCSSANGFVLAPVGSVHLIRERAYVRLLLWNGFFILPMGIYLYRYQFGPPGPFHLSSAVIFFFEFLGWAIPSFWAARLVGVLLLLAIVGMVRGRFDRIGGVYVYSALWVVATAFLAAGVRGGADARVDARYTKSSGHGVRSG